MARVYSSQNGVMRGRIGSTVYRKGQNATTAAQYQPQVSNPKTDAQCIQRAAFATAVQAQSALSSIVDHSHKSLSGKRANLQRFVKDNTASLRAILLNAYAGENVPEVIMNLKGVPGIQPAPYKVSEGSLPFRPTIWISGSDTEAGINISGSIATGINSQETYAAVLRNMGLTPGDQLSLILIVSAGELAGSYNPVGTSLYKNYQCHVLASRVTFKTQIPDGFSGELTTDNRWNPDLVVTEEGGMAIGDSTTAAILALTDERLMDGEKVLAAVVVRSALDINGKFDYSTSTMVASQWDAFDMSPDWAARSYGPGQSVRLGDQPFLDHPVEAGRVEAPAAANTLTSNAPMAVTQQGGQLYVSLPSEPSSLILNVRFGGIDYTSNNVVGAAPNSVLVQFAEQKSLKLAEYQYDEAESYIDMSVEGAEATEGGAVVLGGRAVIGGVTYTF